MGFSWNCPHCSRAATIGESDRSEDSHRYAYDTKLGKILLKTIIVVCPNPDCKQPMIAARLFNYHASPIGGGITVGKQLQAWQLRPDSDAKVLPPYVPDPIVEDYYEACRIRELSPKASATLARRCLQGMIRDFWKVSGKRTLFEEIEAIENQIDPLTWEAIDSVRKIGNIGAHMEKDINTIIDVDPDEAALLLQLIEHLVDDWYKARWNREENKKKLIALATEKDAEKKPVTS
ncbi:DUF4145 domain-containing protein [Bdellovibrio sp. GT3]|uniref:DUF4145 domain-containing protein n=1 Tax=Bdellovibrio sp. GT3 TaxID=3136282 RepID=UPI0030F27803